MNIHGLELAYGDRKIKNLSVRRPKRRKSTHRGDLIFRAVRWKRLHKDLGSTRLARCVDYPSAIRREIRGVLASYLQNQGTCLMIAIQSQRPDTLFLRGAAKEKSLTIG